MAEEGANKDDKEEEKIAPATTTIKKEKKEERPVVQDFNYWLAKVMEYEALSTEEFQEGRTTRRKF